MLHPWVSIVDLKSEAQNYSRQPIAFPHVRSYRLLPPACFYSRLVSVCLTYSTAGLAVDSSDDDCKV